MQRKTHGLFSRRYTTILWLLAAGGCDGTEPTDTFTLTVQRSGNGAGSVLGDGIDCGADCSESYPSGTTVILTAAAGLGSSLGGWSGCDTTTDTTCTVTMGAARAVVATFTALPSHVVDADITEATMWSAGTYHVTRSITVRAPLAIQGGVTVLFDEGVSIDAMDPITMDGASAAAPVTFTSAAGAPAGGDWGGVKLRASGSVFRHCAFLYAGAEDRAALSLADGISASITDCVFAHHRTPTDSVDGDAALDASQAAAGTVIERNTFYDDRVPLAVSTRFSPGLNTFDNALAAPTAPQPSKYNAVFVAGCGHVTTQITWPTQPVPYVIGNGHDACNYVNVDASGQLTIGSAEQPAVVKLHTNGSLHVAGTIAPHAVFTSIKDDRGGDTNGDAAATTPAGGDWHGLQVTRSGSTFDGVGIYYAGGDDSSALKVSDGVVITVARTTFAHNLTVDDSIEAPPALDASGAGAGTVIEENVFLGNVVPLAINTTFSIGDSNVFSGGLDGAAEVANKYQAIIIAGCGHITRTITWAATRVPLVIGEPGSACKYVQVDRAGQLDIADRVVIKLFTGGSIGAQGVIHAEAATGIVFTSFRDDAHGGDTNADGAASAPAGGDWNGIDIAASGSRFDKVSFLFGGGAATGADESLLRVTGSYAVTVTHSVFAHNRPATDGLDAPAALDLTLAAAATVFTDNRYFDNTVPLSINGALSIDDTSVFDAGGGLLPNRYHAVVLESCTDVTATTRWSLTHVPLVVGEAAGCTYMNVRAGGSLAIGAGVTMKFFLDGALFVAAGGALAVNEGAWLTSIRDDHGGDTNADGAASAPAVGDWAGIKRYHSDGDPTCDAASYLHYQTPNEAGGDCAW